MKKLVLLFIILSGNLAMAQQVTCATDQYHQQLVEKDPSLIKDLQQLIANSMVQKSDEDTTIFVIPVVFHILHRNGIENIPDANVFDAMEVLNNDFRMQNSDLSDVIPAFDTLTADIRIEFKLAAYDPWGNCTNGIDRIYSHEALIGDNYCKLNQWDRSRYLNIWVVGNMDSGTAGYAFYPTDVNNLNYWLDGIVIRHTYVGRLTPSNVHTSRSLTHEVGHWLSLPHVWGSTNTPGVICGDDGINDTPVTQGFTSCPATPQNAIVCDPNGVIVENYQNYMDYSFCRHMFTIGQSAVMRHAIQQTDGQRQNLITATTHQSTGIDLTSPHVCVPKPSIRSDRMHACVGQNIVFTDQSFNGPVNFREWAFQDGTPATSTTANPTVMFNSPGRKSVTITVGNASGQVTETFHQLIDVQPDWAFYTGGHSFDLESPAQDPELTIVNDGNTFSQFAPVSVGYMSNRSLKLTTYKDISTALPGTEESRYYNNLGGQIDEIITPSFDLRYTSDIVFSFDYSYATNATQTSMMTEQIQVFYSRDCGNIWTPLGGNTQSIIQGATLATAGFAGGGDYTPSSSADWGNFSIPFLTSPSNNLVRFKIRFVASDYSNNLYIDNIRISGTLGMGDLFSSVHELTISPNPVVSGNNLQIEYIAGKEPVTFILRNLQGEEITSVVRNDVDQPVSFGFKLSDQIAPAYYFLEIKSASAATVKKIAVVR